MALTGARETPLDAPIGIGERLGLDQPAGWWPTAPRLKSYEAAGFRHVQVRMPPRSLLEDPELVITHAVALRENLSLTGLDAILHAPDDLLAGSAEGDRQFDGALTYAAVVGAVLIVYHGARVAVAAPDASEQLRDEERSLRRLLKRAGTLGVRIAIENLAPVFPGPAYISYDPAAVYELARRLDSEHAGVCLDIGHAHIAAGAARRELTEVVEPLLDRVLVFHVHDNFGADPMAPRAGGIEPARLDLHLAPGAGNVPWDRLRPLIIDHVAPLQLEVHPAQRPEPGTLAVLMREVLGLGGSGW